MRFTIAAAIAVMVANGFGVHRSAKRVYTSMTFTLSDDVTRAAFKLLKHGFSLPPVDFESRGGAA